MLSNSDIMEESQVSCRLQARIQTTHTQKTAEQTSHLKKKKEGKQTGEYKKKHNDQEKGERVNYTAVQTQYLN